MEVPALLTPDTFTPILKKLISTPDKFGADDSRLAFHHLLRPSSATPDQIGSFLTALHLTRVDQQSDVLAAAAAVLHHHAVRLKVEGVEEDFVVDIVGTGGDGWNTFNVSTTAAIVAAGAGARLLKHGNKASTSKSGSADLLRALSCPLVPLSPIYTPGATCDNLHPVSALTRPLPRIPFQFLLATDYHPALSLVAPLRRMLPFRTIFNILGPLVNPARPQGIVVGVAEPWLGPVFARAIREGGVKRGLVVCGKERLDELSCAGETDAWQLHESGEIASLTLHPRMFGLPTHPLCAVSGGDAEENAQIFERLLNPSFKKDTIPEELKPILDFVLINAGALLVVSGIAKDWKHGADLARESALGGMAWEALVKFREAGEQALKEVQPSSS
ncbi:anthranilate phosphoribosyltransferase, TrpD [Gautieria morchelliformis]|nr:anthranilate phosphoribosyltransferase, TrpD [Gautieria morchelliformis]